MSLSHKMSVVDGECKDYSEIAYAEEGGSEIKNQKKHEREQ